jgi:DnaA family protein
LSAGRLPPVDLPLREDLRTRLGWGHVFALQPLPEAETRAALRQEADRRGIFLSDEVMTHLLTHHPRDLGHLGQVLDALDDYGLALGRRITVPLLRQMQADGALPAAHSAAASAASLAPLLAAPLAATPPDNAPA